MLSNLNIQNYALIKKLDIHFQQGLNTITGETGAGKSILLGAIGLILGNRADTQVLSDKSVKCFIEGTFLLASYNLRDFFNEHDLDYDDETVIRREITPSGKSRAFINDTPVNLKALKSLGQQLVDIHSQHQTIRLNDEQFQIRLLDAFANQNEEVDQFEKQFREYKSKSGKLEELKSEKNRQKRDEDYYRFQLEELEKTELSDDEFNRAEEEYNLLNHAENIKLAIEKSIYDLSENENNILATLRNINNELAAYRQYHQTLSALTERMNSAFLELEDIARELSHFNHEVQVDEARKAELEERISNVNQLLQKHQQTSVGGLISLKESWEQRLQQMDSMDEAIRQTEERVRSLEKELEEKAARIREGRRKIIPGVSHAAGDLLHELGIPNGILKIELTPAESMNSKGKDNIRFLFSANKGNEPRPLNQVASGGELSRLMLTLKYLQADSIFLPTIVFDEIDSGISGEVALKTGEVISRLSRHHQVVCITHLPQIAALGSHHYTVFKKTAADSTQTYIEKLPDQQRVEEIAKMLGGENPSEGALQNAKELINKTS